MISRLDHAGEFVLQGWAAHTELPTVTVSVDIHINGRFVARLPAATYRSDLEAAGYGDGRHAFFFNPFEHLNRRSNTVEVRESASSKLLDGGTRVIEAELALGVPAYREARARAQLRWVDGQLSGSEAGALGFWEHLQLGVHFHPGLRILEAGCGGGFLLKRILSRRPLFGSYVGMDFSRAAVASLCTQFTDARLLFLNGDAARYPFSHRFHLVIASSLCEYLFPSLLPLLKNVTRALEPGGIAAFDLAVEDDRTSISRAEWSGGGYRRLYSEAEIRRLLSQAGLEPLQFTAYSTLDGSHRVFVSALKYAWPDRNRLAFA